MRENRTKAKLKAGEAVLGCLTRTPDAALVEFLGYCGWDFVILDAEHGTYVPRDIEHLLRAAELRDMTPVVRVTTNQPATILRLMDTGAQGVQVPMVNTASEAEAAVRAVKYKPRGARGLAGIRAAGYGQVQPLKAYVVQANAETLVVAQVETVEAVEALPEIVQVPDLDVLFIGPTDLSHSMGFPGEVQHPDVQRTIRHIVEVVNDTDKAVGLLVPDADAVQVWQARGVQYVVVTLEALLGPACRSFLDAARALPRVG